MQNKPTYRLVNGDALESLKQLADNSVQCCITSPPYWGLRDYGAPGQLGLEPTPEEYVSNIVAVMAEVRRVLKTDGTLWLNLGDSYAGSSQVGGTKSKEKSRRAERMFKSGLKVPAGLKAKDLVGIPWRVALALQVDGWYLRSDIIWHKPNPMPESVTDRPTRAHEYVFLLTKSASYYYDAEAVREPNAPGSTRWGSHSSSRTAKAQKIKGEHGASSLLKKSASKAEMLERYYTNGRNRRTVWTVATRPFKGAHFATFPAKLVEPCVLAGSRPGDVVLDPFAGASTTGLVALENGRDFIGIELNPQYITLSQDRLKGFQAAPELSAVA